MDWHWVYFSTQYQAEVKAHWRFYINCAADGSDSETDDDNDKGRFGEAETDDEEEFFDTKESLKSSSSVELQTSDREVDMELVGLNYPKVHRRKSLPQPKEKEKSVSLWSMIKDNIGKDLSKVCLPVYFNEPISSLQRCFEDVEYAYLLDRAYEYGRRVSVNLNLVKNASFSSYSRFCLQNGLLDKSEGSLFSSAGQFPITGYHKELDVSKESG